MNDRVRPVRRRVAEIEIDGVGNLAPESVWYVAPVDAPIQFDVVGPEFVQLARKIFASNINLDRCGIRHQAASLASSKEAIKIVFRHRTRRHRACPLSILFERAQGLVAEPGRRERGRWCIIERQCTGLLNRIDAVLKFTGHGSLYVSVSYCRSNASPESPAKDAPTSAASSRPILRASLRANLRR